MRDVVLELIEPANRSPVKQKVAANSSIENDAPSERGGVLLDLNIISI